MAKPRGKISAKHALTPKEIEFCKVYVAFGNTNHTEAYRRAFCIARLDGTFAEPPVPHMDDEAIKGLPALTPKEISRRAGQLLKQAHIQMYVEEISRPAGDHARGVLADTARFGKAGESLRAADQILSQEDKHGFREAVERWAEILCEIGSEIEVPLPHECPHCGKALYASVPFAEMFKQKEG